MIQFLIFLFIDHQRFRLSLILDTNPFQSWISKPRVMVNFGHQVLNSKSPKYDRRYIFGI